MSSLTNRAGFAVVLLIALSPRHAVADMWDPPEPKVIPSADGACRVHILPREESSADTKGRARVECLQAGGWRVVWDKPVVNKVVPNDARIANDASHLVTFDNWGSVGRGDDVVVVYDRRGDVVRKLSLEQLLPPAYIRWLPHTTSITGWHGERRLVEGDAEVEMEIVEPGSDAPGKEPVTVRVRLADGAIVPPSGPAWERAMARVQALDIERKAKWDAKRREHATPLDPPTSGDPDAWYDYAKKLGNRLFGYESHDEFVVRARSSEADADFQRVADWVARWTGKGFDRHTMTFASPDSARLARVLSTALKARAPGSMAGFHLVFVGSTGEGAEVAEASVAAGARFTLIDKDKPGPLGKPMPETPPAEDSWEWDF